LIFSPVPGQDLSDDEREEVKKVARQLLQRVKQALVINWRQKAQVRLAIEDELDEGLPRVYLPELYPAEMLCRFRARVRKLRQ